MHIHFVCHGNIYRSRLAETYLRSKQRPAIVVSSSGIDATVCDGPVSWIALRILQQRDLVPFLSPQPTQTTIELLQHADLVVFMEEVHATFAREHLGYTGKTFLIWYIPDLLLSDLDLTRYDLDTAMIRASEVTYQRIASKVDELLPFISA
jgi:protein-tyrosine-phosphatase